MQIELRGSQKIYYCSSREHLPNKNGFLSKPGDPAPATPSLAIVHLNSQLSWCSSFSNMHISDLLTYVCILAYVHQPSRIHLLYILFSLLNQLLVHTQEHTARSTLRQNNSCHSYIFQEAVECLCPGLAMVCTQQLQGNDI